jgi:hypothetical protein
MQYLLRLLAVIGWIWAAIFAAILFWKLKLQKHEDQS